MEVETRGIDETAVRRSVEEDGVLLLGCWWYCGSLGERDDERHLVGTIDSPCRVTKGGDHHHYHDGALLRCRDCFGGRLPIVPMSFAMIAIVSIVEGGGIWKLVRGFVGVGRMLWLMSA